MNHQSNQPFMMQAVKMMFYCLTAFLFLSPSVQVFAQTPQAIPYQAIARDANSAILANQTISLQFSLHDSSASGPLVYQETQQVITTNLGLFTCQLGLGTPVIGSLSNVPWSTGNKFLQVEFDPTGGTNYTDMGTTQLLSVPYALYAEQSNGWSTTGNSGTNPNTHSLGTTDANDLLIKTDNFETARFYSNPTTGGGINPPVDHLRLTRSGLVNQKWPMVASFQLGSYEANLESRTQLDISLLHGWGVNADTKIMTLLSNGHVGLGNTTPHAPLQLSNALLNRKLVLFETNDNDHEFLGLGVNSNMLRYQVANAGDNHVFFSGNGSNASNELLRITGSGQVGIGTSTPAAQLHTTGGVRFEALSGVSKRPVYVDSNGTLSAGADSVQTFSVTPNAVFNNYFESPIQVSGQTTLSSANISVHINYQEDNARFFLKSPNGDILNLLSIANGLLISVDADFNDNGTPIPPNQTSINGLFQPLGDMTVTGGTIIPTVSNFASINGGSINPNGTWTLIMWTAYNFSYGQLNSWSISFNNPNNTQGIDGYHPLWHNGGLTLASSIYDNGKVGILTNTPQRALDVRGDIAQGIWTDNIPSRRIGVMDASTHVAGMEIENTTLGDFFSQKLHLLTHYNGVGYGRRLTIDEEGKVGIGTQAPTEKLDVDGIGKFGQHLKIGTNVSEGYFQNEQNGAYRALASGGEQGYLFQNFNGANTSMFVGLNGSYQGRVGIGTTSPQFRLHVSGHNNAIKITGAGNIQEYGQLNFGDANYVYLKEDIDDQLTIHANRIALDGGNVGIGTFSPTAKLTVNNNNLLWIAANMGSLTGNRVVMGKLNGAATIGGHSETLTTWQDLNINPVNSEGHVNIGTESGFAKLNVFTNTGWIAYFRNLSNSNSQSNDAGIYLMAGNDAGVAFPNLIHFVKPNSSSIGVIGQTSSNSISLQTPSDRRLKENIHPTRFGLADLKKIQVSDYDYIQGTKNMTGFIAQQLYDVYPLAVSVGSEDTKTKPWMVDYAGVTPLIVKSVQELSEQVEQKNKEIILLKQQLDAQQQQLDELKAIIKK